MQTEAGRAAHACRCRPAERDELGGSALSQHWSLTSCAEALPGESLLEDLNAISPNMCV